MKLKNLLMDTSSLNNNTRGCGTILAEFATSGDAEKCYHAIWDSFENGDMKGLGDDCVQAWTCHNYFTIFMDRDIDIVNDFILMISEK